MSISVHSTVACQEPDALGSVLLPEVRKLLVAQSLEGSRVKDSQAQGQGIVNGQLPRHLRGYKGSIISCAITLKTYIVLPCTNNGQHSDTPSTHSMCTLSYAYDNSVQVPFCHCQWALTRLHCAASQAPAVPEAGIRQAGKETAPKRALLAGPCLTNRRLGQLTVVRFTRRNMHAHGINECNYKSYVCERSFELSRWTALSFNLNYFVHLYTYKSTNTRLPGGARRTALRSASTAAGVFTSGINSALASANHSAAIA